MGTVRRGRGHVAWGVVILLVLGSGVAAARAGVPAGLAGAEAAHPAVPTEAQNVALVGHVGGASHAVVVSGTYAYVGEGPRLTIFDVTTSAAPIVAGKTPPLPGIVQDIVLAGHHAYVADWHAGLRVVDVSDPTTPVEIGFYDTPGYARGLAVAGSYAYVADSEEGLRVLDVSTPSAPVEVGFCDTQGSAYGVAVAGGYAYVADESNGLRVIDVSDPSAPVEVGFYDTPGWSGYVDVAVTGAYAYVADYRDALRVLDVSDPTTPVQVSTCALSAWDVVLDGSYAYVAGGPDSSVGLAIVDVSDPAAPVEAGSLDIPAWATGVAVAGGYAYVAEYGGGMWVVDVSDPAAPAGTGSYAMRGLAQDVSVQGDAAYVADYLTPLVVVDVSIPWMPNTVSSVGDLGSGSGIVVSGDKAYVAGEGNAPNWVLSIVDVSMPSEPERVGTYDVPYAYGHDVAVDGDYAYVTTYGWGSSALGLRVIDVSEPSAPVGVSYFYTWDEAFGVALDAGYAYIVTTYGLWVVDVSSPSTPQEAGYYPSGQGSPYRDVDVADGYAYMAGENGGLQVIDVSDPSAPAEVAFCDLPGYGLGVAVDDGYAYVAADDAGLRIVDVSEPTAPVEVGFYDTPYGAFGVTVVDGYAYVADAEGGLFILQYEGMPAPVLSSVHDPEHDRAYIVDWSAVDGATRYLVQEDDNPAFTSPALRYTGPETHYAVAGQPVGTWYYRVEALSAGSGSPWSNAESVAVAPQAPALDPIANPDGDGRYTVAWSPVTGAAEYLLEEDDNVTFTSPLVRHSGAGTTWTATGQPVGMWYYRVQATGTTGSSLWSNTAATTVKAWFYLPLVVR